MRVFGYYTRVHFVCVRSRQVWERETKRKFAYWEALHEWVVVVVGCFVGGWTCCVNPHTTPCHLILIPIICVTFIFNVSVQLIVKYCITDDLGGKLVFYYNMTIFPPTHPPTNCHSIYHQRFVVSENAPTMWCSVANGFTLL